MSLIQHNRIQLTGFVGSFPNVGSLPIIANNGQFAITLDTNTFYIYNGGVWNAATGGGGGGSPTNLGIGTSNATVLQITSSTGSSVTLPNANGTIAGVLTAADWNIFNNKQNAIINPVQGLNSSVDGEVVLFSGTTGKVLKSATGTGVAKITSGVLGVATSGADYAPATTGTSLLKGNGAGGFANAIAGTDFQSPIVNAVSGSGTSGQFAQFNGVNSIIGVTESTAFNKDFETLTTNIKMDGTASVGILSTIPRADHVHPKDTTKADKVTSATAGNIATLDATGNLVDSGLSPTTLPISTPVQNALNLKQNLVSSPILNDILLTDATGQSFDSGVQISTDGSFSADSDFLLPTQKAVATYVANNTVSSGKVGVYAITLTNFNATYNNGVLGVGATLTATANGVFTADGVAVPASEAVLVNSQTNSFQNGIYIVTVAGNIGTPAVLTRRTDYDQFSEIKIGDTVFVENGNTQAGTLWYQTEAVATMGTSPISFSTVSVGSGFLEISNNLSELTATASTARTNILAAKSGANTDITSVLLSQSGLNIKDGGVNQLTIKDNETLTASRTLNIVTGDADRTLTFTGNATVAGVNTGDQTITLTGDVTGSGTGSFATTISANAVTTTKIINSAVTGAKVATNTITGGLAGNIALATITSANIANATITGTQIAGNTVANSNLAQMPALTLKGNDTGLVANATDLTSSQVRAMLFQRVTFSDANYSINAGESFIAQVGTLTAHRSVTLPLANAVSAGFVITIADESGSVGSNRITVNASGGDNIVGTNNKIAYPYGSLALTSNGANQWTADASETKRGNILYGFQPVAAVATNHIASLNIVGLGTVDGYTVQSGDRILLVGQTNPIDNGVYIAKTTPGIWSKDYDFAPDTKISREQYIGVINGTVNAGTTWKVTQGGLASVNPITFSKISIVGTDLGTNAPNPTNVQVTSSTGTAATLPVATTTIAGILTAADWTTFNDKAPIASPAFTGVPTAPTAILGTNTTQIATTAFVNNLINNVFSATVGPLVSGATYLTVAAAVTAGASNIRVIGNTTDSASITIPRDTYIVVSTGVTWTTSNDIPNAYFMQGSNAGISIVLETEGSGVIKFNLSSGGIPFLKTFKNFYRNNFNFDMTFFLPGGSILFSNITTIYSTGTTLILLPNSATTGINYSTVTGDIYENANIIFVGGGNSCSGFFTTSKGTFSKITVTGTVSTGTIINVSNVAINILEFNLNSANNTQMIFSGTINNIINKNNSNILLTLQVASGDNSTIMNANLGGGTLNINNKVKFLGTNIRANTATNKTADSVFTGCFFTTPPTRISSTNYKDVNPRSSEKDKASFGASPINPSLDYKDVTLRSGGERANSIGALVEETNPLDLYVDSHVGDDILNNGTDTYPFATVSNAQLFSANNSIIHLRGTINENITFNAFDFQVLTGQNIAFEPLTTINGQLTITGASERIYISDLAINYNAGSPIYIDSTNGAHGMNNLYITTTSAYAIEIDYSTSINTQKVFISNTDFRTTTGIIMLTDIVGIGTGTLELDNCIGVNIHIGNGWSVIVNNSSIASQTRSARSGTITYLNLASSASTGYLSSADWNTFNDKVSVSGGSTVVNNLALFATTNGHIKDNGISISTDGTMVANSNSLIPTQAAVKTYSLNRFANDFTTFPHKLSSAGSDVILIEDSANSGAKAYLTVNSINVDGGTF